MYTKWILTILLASCWTLPLAAQVNVTKEKGSLEQKVSQAVQRTVVKSQPRTSSANTSVTTPYACDTYEGLTPQDLIEAETQLQRIRDTQDPNASFPTYPQLLQKEAATTPPAKKLCLCDLCGELTVEDLIEAEIQLQRLRETKDPSASFSKYPQLLKKKCTCPHVEIAPQQVPPTQGTQVQQTHPGYTWKTKVGL